MTNKPGPIPLLAACATMCLLAACAGRAHPPARNAAAPPATLATVAAAGGRDGTVADRRPSTGPAEQPDGAELLRALLERKPLRFATGGDNDAPAEGPEHFHFFLNMKQPGPDGQPRVTRVLVVREGEQVALLCTSSDGLPYAYLTQGLLVTVDRANPGGLVVLARGAPSFVLAADEAGDRLVFEMSHHATAARPTLVLDLASLLRATLGKLKDARLDAARRHITARTENSTVVVGLPAEGDAAAPPVTAFMSAGPAGTSVSVVSLSVGSPPPVRPAAIDAPAVLGSGLPVRPLTAGEARTFRLAVPPDFGGNPRERRAARALGRLLSGEKPLPPRRDPPVERIHNVVRAPASPPIGHFASAG